MSNQINIGTIRVSIIDKKSWRRVPSEDQYMVTGNDKMAQAMPALRKPQRAGIPMTDYGMDLIDMWEFIWKIIFT